ncbi:MAG: heavy-metal-associated domain-containing protein [Nitrospinaceae bacterium]
MAFHQQAASTLKTLGGVLVILCLGIGAAGAQEAKSVYKVYVDGLSCPFCTYGIEKKFSKVEGVEKIDIDLKTGTTLITMTPGTTLDETAARKAVEAAGFTLRDFEQVQVITKKKTKG